MCRHIGMDYLEDSPSSSDALQLMSYDGTNLRPTFTSKKWNSIRDQVPNETEHSGMNAWQLEAWSSEQNRITYSWMHHVFLDFRTEFSVHDVRNQTVITNARKNTEMTLEATGLFASEKDNKDNLMKTEINVSHFTKLSMSMSVVTAYSSQQRQSTKSHFLKRIPRTSAEHLHIFLPSDGINPVEIPRHMLGQSVIRSLDFTSDNSWSFNSLTYSRYQVRHFLREDSSVRRADVLQLDASNCQSFHHDKRSTMQLHKICAIQWPDDLSNINQPVRDVYKVFTYKSRLRNQQFAPSCRQQTHNVW